MTQERGWKTYQAVGGSKTCDRPRPTQGLSGPLGPEPRKSPKRVRKSTPGQGPKSAQRVRPGVSKDSEKSLKSDFRTLFGLFRDSGAHSLGTLGPCPGVLFPDSFRTLPGFRARRARETLCGAWPIAIQNHFLRGSLQLTAQQVLNPTPLNPTTCHQPKRKAALQFLGVSKGGFL